MLYFKLIYIFLCGDVKPGVKFCRVVTMLLLFYYSRTFFTWIVTTLNGESKCDKYDVPFVGFLFMIELSSSVR